MIHMSKYLRRLFFLVRYPKVHRIARAERVTLDSKDPEELRNLSLSRFSELTRECLGTNPFYRDLWTQHGVDFTNPQLTPQDLPIVTKAQLKPALANGTILRPLNSGRKISWLKTTGSTGEPFMFPIDADGVARREASRVLCRERYGHQIGDTMVSMWRGTVGKTPWRERLLNALHGTQRICIFDPTDAKGSALSEARLTMIFHEMCDIDPEFIDGYVSALTLFARFCLKTGLKYRGRNLKAVTTGAEVLSDQERADIQAFFQTPVINRYGGTETSLIAHEFLQPDGQQSNYLRVCAEKILVELVSEDGQYVSPGELGRVIVTDFTNRAMPLIRYDVGDYARGLSTGVQYGLSEVVGRRNTFFRNSEGNLISTHIWQNYLREMPTISGFLIEQTTVSNVFVYIKRAQHLGPDDEINQLTDKIRKALPGSSVEIKYVKEIPLGPGGKFVQCVSHVV